MVQVVGSARILDCTVQDSREIFHACIRKYFCRIFPLIEAKIQAQWAKQSIKSDLDKEGKKAFSNRIFSNL